MADVAAAMSEGLLAFPTAAGLVVMLHMLDAEKHDAELASIVGTKHTPSSTIGSGTDTALGGLDMPAGCDTGEHPHHHDLTR